ncbi:Ectoine utilization protein EutE [Hondaea fermentalgiana]|uniref:Ectoine utilization protein EutE n=1 Tax=Hondaea fermentalgiana TaxID=2315210 RepID=A0A2R5GVG8_9STRA|nr:Ectoine utilization protein EutE [Hondaea fermentalgiana]|eukprot:GBG33768.1 Ectoine utilization protein EutE [Hondaea fermentalgiana]
MKFGKTIRLEQNLSWNSKWIDLFLEYKELKQLLNAHIDSFGRFKNVHAFMEEFKPRWKREVLKIDGHLKRQMQTIRTKVKQDAEKAQAGGNGPDHELQLKWVLSLKRLARYNEINHEGQNKFIKKVLKHLEDDTPSDVVASIEKLSERVVQSSAKHAQELDSLREEIDQLMGPDEKIEYDETEAGERLNELEVDEPVPLLSELALESLPPGQITRLKLALVPNEVGDYITIHVTVAKGRFAGPVLGITSALHGNELNGIPLIFRLFREIDVDSMKGTLVAIPVLNPPGYQRRQRGFHDGQDLNRLFPGNPDGNCGQTYVHHVLEKIIKKFDYHIDMHTASFGRKNSLYVRADMRHPVSHEMALLQHPQIIVHNTAPDGSLRSAAMALGIPSITVEIGDPLVFHNKFVSSALYGVENVLRWLDVQSFGDEEDDEDGDANTESGKNDDSTPKEAESSDAAAEEPSKTDMRRLDSVDSFVALSAGASMASPLSPLTKPPSPHRRTSRRGSVNPLHTKTTICARSKWIYSPAGGVLRVRPEVNTWVTQGEILAIVQNLFGDVVFTLKAPADAIVVGKSTNPICASGDRIIHLGYVEDELPKGKVDDGHT